MRTLPGALLFTLYSVCVNTATGDESCDSKDRAKSPETVLKEGLLCNYVKEESPSDQRNSTVPVTPIMMIKSIDYYEQGSQSKAIIRTIVMWKWTDGNLTWQPNEHHGLMSVWIDPKTIWTPETILLDTVEFKDPKAGKCLLSFHGQVSCSTPTTYNIHCTADMTFWPRDTHACKISLLMGLPIHSPIFNVTLEALSVSFPKHWPSRDWRLLSIDAKVAEEHYITEVLTYDIMLQRHTATYAATLLLPTIVLPVLTVTSYLIDPESPIRLHLCCVNIFTHVFYHQAMGYAVPANGEKCPKIIMFFRDSALLAGITLVLAVAMQWMSSTASSQPPPSWCCRAIAWLLDKRVARIFILISPDEHNTLTSPTEEEPAVDNVPSVTSEIKYTLSWKFLVQVIDRILFHIFVIVCFIIHLIRVL